MQVSILIMAIHSPSQTGERLQVLRCSEEGVVCVLPLLAIADSAEACLIMTASADGTLRVRSSHYRITL